MKVKDRKLKILSFKSPIPNFQYPIQKLAAIGIKVDAQGISRHGFALNVNPDMSYWEGIVGCGLPYPEISLGGLARPKPGMEDVRAEVLKSFGIVFNYQMLGPALDN